jgi:predicted DNA-binding transcriptional regulator AlpA
MTFELNDSEPTLFEVLGLTPPSPLLIKSRRPVSFLPICPPVQVIAERTEAEEIDTERELPTVGLWTAEHVEAFSQFSKSWIYKQVELGALPHIRKGRSVRFDPQAIRDFFSAKKRSRR